MAGSENSGGLNRGLFGANPSPPSYMTSFANSRSNDMNSYVPSRLTAPQLRVLNGLTG
jgi:hypothetical protein